MFKNQKFFISLFCLLGLGIAQVAFAPEDPAAMYGSADESGTDSNTRARNQARQNAQEVEQARLNQFNKMSLFAKAKAVKSGKVSVAEALSGKPDALKVKLARKRAALNEFDRQHPMNTFEDEGDWVYPDSDTGREERAKKVQVEIENKTVAEKQQEEKEKTFLQNLPKNIFDLNLSVLNEKNASGELTMSLVTMQKVLDAYFSSPYAVRVIETAYFEQARKDGLPNDLALYHGWQFFDGSMGGQLFKSNDPKNVKIVNFNKSKALDNALKQAVIDELTRMQELYRRPTEAELVEKYLKFMQLLYKQQHLHQLYLQNRSA